MTTTIILTAAIKPKTQQVRKDVRTRLTDYICAIRRWLAVGELDRVIVQEGNGAFIPNVFDSDKYECVSSTLRYVVGANYGRLELEGMSRLLRKRPEIESFYKCTGRLFVSNFRALSGHIENHNLGLNIYPQMYGNRDLADVRFYQCTASFWHKHIDSDALEPSRYIRYADANPTNISRYFIEKIKENPEQVRFIPQPIYVGFAGKDKPYEEDFTEEEYRYASDIIEKYGMESFGLGGGLKKVYYKK